MLACTPRFPLESHLRGEGSERKDARTEGHEKRFLDYVREGDGMYDEGVERARKQRSREKRAYCFVMRGRSLRGQKGQRESKYVQREKSSTTKERTGKEF